MKVNSLEYNLPFTELYFFQLAIKCCYDLDCIVEKLKSKEIDLDSKCKGWWAWDFVTNREIYSDRFRVTLGATKENFPDVPESWQKFIKSKDLELALENLAKHIETKGSHPFSQLVTYDMVDESGEITVICHGIVVKWSDDGSPALMLGLHFNEDGSLEL